MSSVVTKRVRDVARELGVEVKELLEAAERMGIRGKRPLSGLTDEETRRIQQALGRDPESAVSVAIGEERVIRDHEGQTRVERRLSANVIRRRAATGSPATPAAQQAETAPVSQAESPTTAVPSAPEAFLEPLQAIAPTPLDDTALPPPLPLDNEVGGLGEVEADRAVGLGDADSSPAAAPGIESRAETGHEELRQDTIGGAEQEVVSAAAKIVPTPAMVPSLDSGSSAPSPGQVEAGSEASSRAPVTAAEGEAEAPLRGPKVLGRINLRQVSPPAGPNRGRQMRDRAGGGVGRDRVPVLVPPPPPPLGDDRPRKKKRRVVERGELPETVDMERPRHRVPRKKKASPGQEVQKTEITVPRAHKKVIRLAGDAINVRDLAREMAVREAEVVKVLLELGVVAGVNQPVDFDTATLVADHFGFTVERRVDDLEWRLEEESSAVAGEEHLQPRPPVVTIMGHVDHGKTSLLDAIRKTNVTAQEAGGITQHIGAYTVDVRGRQITFLDTPGHEAFTAMRARGAKVTDIVVLVVAADDGVMPQTVEAINHARAANVPIIVAVNKIDKPEANFERVTRQLTEYGLVPEEWGGDTIFVKVSAKTQEGLPELLDMILLQADVLELKANPSKRAAGTIIEAKLDRGRGPVATVLIQEGTLHEGEPFVCGPYFGRVRALINDRGQRVKEAGPSVPVEILGLEGVPEAGSAFTVAPDEATARAIAEQRQAKVREESLVKSSRITLEDLNRRIQAGDVKELRVVLKADVQGSVEALSAALSQLSSDEVKLKILHASVGGIKESDVDLAAASGAIVIGFNVRPEAKASEEARRQGVEIRLYDVIYNVVNDVRDALQGLLAPTIREVILGRAEVREVFKVPAVGSVAGVQVLEGKILRSAEVRLIRDSVVVYTGRIASLRRFKEDVREVAAGYECGVALQNFQDIKVGDVIESFEKEEVARQLPLSQGRAVAGERRV